MRANAEVTGSGKDTRLFARAVRVEGQREHRLQMTLHYVATRKMEIGQLLAEVQIYTIPEVLTESRFREFNADPVKICSVDLFVTATGWYWTMEDLKRLLEDSNGPRRRTLQFFKGLWQKLIGGALCFVVKFTQIPCVM